MNIDEEEWETDYEGDSERDKENHKGGPIEYFRIKYDNVTKVKFQIKKIVNFISKKYKRIDTEAQEKLKVVNKLLNEEIIPTFGIKSSKLYSETEDEFDKVFLVGNEYNLIKKPEIGSCLFFELNTKNNISNNLNLVGVSNEFYEATTKIFKRSRLEEINKPKVIIDKEKKKINRKKKKKIVKIEGGNNEVIKQLVLKRNLKLNKKYSNNFKNKNDEVKLENTKDNNILKLEEDHIENNDEEYMKNKKKRKRKKIKKYIRNSTIITINKIK